MTDATLGTPQFVTQTVATTPLSAFGPSGWTANPVWGTPFNLHLANQVGGGTLYVARVPAGTALPGPVSATNRDYELAPGETRDILVTPGENIHVVASASTTVRAMLVERRITIS